MSENKMDVQTIELERVGVQNSQQYQKVSGTVVDTMIEEILDNNDNNNGDDYDESLKRKSTIVGVEASNESERHEEDDFYESETPIAFLNMHLFEQIDAKGRFRTKNENKMDLQLDPKTLKDLSLTITITDILNIDPVTETFTVKYRYFALWEEDLHSIGLEEYANKAKEIGHYYPLSRIEVDHFIEKIHLPKIILFNQASITETDVLDIRIYGGERGRTAVMINQSFIAVCRERFVLHTFPFDLQYLHLEYRLNDAISWNSYNLTINLVQMHQECLHQLEWTLLVPIVKRGFPRTAHSTIHLPVQRKSQYYVTNIIFIIFILTALGLSAFACESDDLVARTFCVLTMILTGVAFKFTSQEELPKVPYITILDHFMGSSLWILSLMTVFCIIPNFYVDEDEHEHLDHKINTALAFTSIGLIIITFGYFGFISYRTVQEHAQKHCVIPLEKDRPWYSFRFSNPKHLVDVNPDVPFHESLKTSRNPVVLPKQPQTNPTK